MVPKPLQKLGGDSIHYVHTFSIWVIDVIGKIAPKVLNGHKYILVVIDYFTKWVGGSLLLFNESKACDLVHRE